MGEISAKIGKFALDSLTVGMYENSMVLYREYIQNSTDAIDKAINELKILKSKGESKIDIIVDDKKKLIKIMDNGSGIEKTKVVKTLCDIGNSEKDFSKNRGFRGIGRLSGTAYCETLIFKTSYKGEDQTSILKWDCTLLKELVKPGQHEGLTLEDVIKKCVSIYYEDELIEKHYFEVILEGVEESKLLNEEDVKSYLAQVAPIEMNSIKFYYYSDLQDGIKKFMKENKIDIEEYPIEFNKKKLTKLYSATKLETKKEKEPDEILGIKKDIIKDENGNPIAFIWYGERRDFIGILTDSKICGLRYRKNNIMVGDYNTVSKLFPEDRFNKYFIGEIYVLDENVIPNARRDDFEDNDSYKYLKSSLEIYFKKISARIRPISDLRNAEKKINADSQRILKLNKELKTKLPKDEKQLVQDEIDKLKLNIEKYVKDKNKAENRLQAIGESKYIKNIEINENKCNKDNSKPEKKKNEKIEKEEDPLKGKTREVKKVVRKILKVLKENLDEKSYENIKDNIYKSI